MAGITGLQPLSGSFPNEATAGQTGAGSLWSQGTTHQKLNLPANAKNVNVKSEYGQDSYPAPYSFDDTGLDFILPGELNPDRTPRTHNAPVPGWAPNYAGEEIAQLRINSTEVHSEDFGALVRRTNPLPGDAEPSISFDYSNNPGENNLQPVTGQLRAMGGYDRTQGYNLSNRFGFDAGHRKRTNFNDPQPTYSLDPAERPFIVPQGGVNAKFTDVVQGPQGGNYSWGYGDGASPYNEPSAYSPPPEPATFTGQYSEGPVVGWD